MASIDFYFNRKSEPLRDLRLRNWKSRLECPGVTATLEIFQPEVELGQSQAEMNLQFTENGKTLPLETIIWNDELNSGLIELNVRAVNAEQEAVRFALGLRAEMRRPSREFGDGFFNSVLVEFINKESDFASYPEITGIMQHIYSGRPHREGGGLDRYSLCLDMIEEAIRGRAQELKDSLGYSDEEARKILISAIARFLDERFSVSSRKRLGWL